MKTFWRRFTRDFVDMFLWFTILALLIKLISNNKIAGDIGMAMLFFGSLLLLYILGTMWRMGAAIEIMNEFIRDDEERRNLNMLPYEMRDRAWQKDLKEWIFAGIWIIILILFIVL